MRYSEARQRARARVAADAPMAPGIEFVVADDALVVPDADSDGFGAYVVVLAVGGGRSFESMLYIQSADGEEVVDDEVADALA